MAGVALQVNFGAILVRTVVVKWEARLDNLGVEVFVRVACQVSRYSFKLCDRLRDRLWSDSNPYWAESFHVRIQGCGM